MKKKLIAGLLSTTLAFSLLVGCSSGSDSSKKEDSSAKSESSEEEEEVEYDLSDEKGIINFNLCEDFEEYTNNSYDTGSKVGLSFEKDSILGTWGYLETTVSYEKIYDYTTSEDADTCASKTTAENVVNEETEFMGMKGHKVTYDDSSNEAAGTEHYVYYFLLPEDTEVGENGMEVVIHYRWTDKYTDADKYLEEQLDELHLDFDAYDWEAAEEESEESTSDDASEEESSSSK